MAIYWEETEQPAEEFEESALRDETTEENKKENAPLSIQDMIIKIFDFVSTGNKFSDDYPKQFRSMFGIPEA